MQSRSRFPIAGTALIVALAFVSASPAWASELILNGGFESGFSDWTRVDQLGSDGTFFVQTGTASPSVGDTVPPPPGGLNAAMSDAQGPGSHLLYQDIVIPTTVVSAILRFDLFLGNRASDYFTPNPESLDFAINDFNQQARVDVLLPSIDPFSLSPSDVLQNVYQTQPGDPLVSGYTTIVADLTSLFAAHAGQTVRLRFAEVDNVFSFQMGVDNVSLSTGGVIPEPATLTLFGLGLVGWAGRRLRSRG